MPCPVLSESSLVAIMQKSWSLLAVSALFAEAPTVAETGFNTLSQKSVSIMRKGLIVEPDPTRRALGQRKCFGDRALFKLYAGFNPELQAFFPEHQATGLLGPEPANWLKGMLIQQIGSGQVAVLRNGTNTVVYAGPGQPYSQHPGGQVINNAFPSFEFEIGLSPTERVRGKSSAQAAAPGPSCAANTVPAPKTRIHAHTHVRFTLLAGSDAREIRSPGGAYSRYVFPTCHRVHWDAHGR